MSRDQIGDEINMTIDEWISAFPKELPRDAIGVYEIVVAGRDDLKLGDASLSDFVLQGILALLDAGAVPVRFGGGSGFDWVRQKQYGIDPDQVAQAIIKEWLAMRVDPLVLYGEGVWFARPNPDRPRFVKLD